jgi:hypothetical protein
MTDDELLEAIEAAVARAMQSEARRALPTHQAMTAQWRIVVTLADGGVVPFDADDEPAALKRGEHFKHRPWRIERRLVAEWLPVPLPPGHGADVVNGERD